MTDARYLVPLSALPFQPHGATLAWECKVCGWVWSPFTAPALSCEHIDGPGVVTCLDLSDPPKRGDIPERLDALGWALAVLGWSDVAPHNEETRILAAKTLRKTHVQKVSP